jgi:hypothetical protein
MCSGNATLRRNLRVTPDAHHVNGDRDGARSNARAIGETQPVLHGQHRALAARLASYCAAAQSSSYCAATCDAGSVSNNSAPTSRFFVSDVSDMFSEPTIAVPSALIILVWR